MCSKASSMSRSVPGSRSAVASAAVVCSKFNWQMPVFSGYCFHSNCSSCSVMSTISRFLWVLIVRRCMAYLFARREQFQSHAPGNGLARLKQDHPRIDVSPGLAVRIGQVELGLDGDKVLLWRSIDLDGLDL